MQFYIFTKNIVIKHIDNYYLPAILRFKLVYDTDGTLSM